jgi:hypothetical protein
MGSLDIKAVEFARELLKAHGYFVDNLWHVDDIHFICEQNSLPNLTHKEAMEVFTIANEQFDGQTGLCWPQLESAVNSYFRRKTLLTDTFNNSHDIINTNTTEDI